MGEKQNRTYTYRKDCFSKETEVSWQELEGNKRGCKKKRRKFRMCYTHVRKPLSPVAACYSRAQLHHVLRHGGSWRGLWLNLFRAIFRHSFEDRRNFRVAGTGENRFVYKGFSLHSQNYSGIPRTGQ